MMNPKKNAFTLMELLVVIAIIGILAGLLFPAVNGAMDSARKAQCKNDVVQIATAITAYETEYGKMPPGGASQVNAALVNILTGQDAANNPRKIVFLEVGARKPTNAPVGKGGKSGTNSSGNFVDAWGRDYNVAMDTNYTGTISAGNPPVSLRKKVGVWNVTTNTRQYVTSWD